MENEEKAEQDTTEELLDTYERKRKNKADDVIATQAVLCILLAIMFCCGSCVIVNPIDLRK